ncbi:MAG: peptidoglycan-binding protein [Bryobacterales bacterium]|nr:peptidoglycan-binding protein [Bryobacterales bacterium]
MRTISQGSKGADVLFLQRLLNKRGAAPALTEDADFGAKTKLAVVSFQNRNRIVPANGTVTSATWTKFGRIIEHEHRVTLYGQPTNMTCWSAAATMMTGSNQSVGPGGSSMFGDGSLDPSLANIEVFVRGMGWRNLVNMSAPPPSQLIAGLARGPIWVVFQGNGFAHAVVFSGVFSDGDESGNGTVFTVHDPWPAGAGKVYSTPYTGRQVILKSEPSRPRAMIAAAAA